MKVNEAILHIVNSNAMQYEELASFLTDNQLSLLKAIAKESCVERPQSNGFITNYNLPGASSIKTALDQLLDKDLVQRTEKGYMVSNFFFEIWLKRLF